MIYKVAITFKIQKICSVNQTYWSLTEWLLDIKNLPNIDHIVHCSCVFQTPWITLKVYYSNHRSTRYCLQLNPHSLLEWVVPFSLDFCTTMPVVPRRGRQ